MSEIIGRLLPYATLAVAGYIGYTVLTTDFRVPPPQAPEPKMFATNKGYKDRTKTATPVRETSDGKYVLNNGSNIYSVDEVGEL